MSCKDIWGNKCTKRVLMQAYFLSATDRGLATMIQQLQCAAKVWGQYEICVPHSFIHGMPLTDDDWESLRTFETECVLIGGKETPYEKLLRDKIGPISGIAVVFLNTERMKSLSDHGWLNACTQSLDAGRTPLIAVRRSPNRYTLAHELGHALLGPNGGHRNWDPSNVMCITDKQQADPPILTTTARTRGEPAGGQLEWVLANKRFLEDC
jgi:hypothetical protein